MRSLLISIIILSSVGCGPKMVRPAPLCPPDRPVLEQVTAQELSTIEDELLDKLMRNHITEQEYSTMLLDLMDHYNSLYSLSCT
jgi:hypothetical protein